MFAGIILIVSGLLILFYPPLLAWIVASLLVLVGVLSIAVGVHHRRLAKHFRNPLVEVFFRL